MAELIFGAVLGTILGGIVSWLITHGYYKRQVREAQESQRTVERRFDDLSHLMKTLLQKTTGVDVDVKSLVTAYQNGSDAEIEKALDTLLPMIKQKHAQAAVLSAIIDIPVPLGITKDDLMAAHRQARTNDPKR